METRFDNRRGHHITAGLIIIATGTLLLLRRAGVLIPAWLLSWPMLLMAVGFISLVKHNFRTFFGWAVFIAGAAFLVQKYYLGYVHIGPFIFPALLIIFGIMLLLKPRRSEYWNNCWPEGRGGDEKKKAEATGDWLDETSVFGGIRRSVVSKSFKGGELTTVFGGMEIDFRQADIEGTAVLDATVVFGGLRIVVPPNWDVTLKITNIAAGVDDKRFNSGAAIDNNKVLIITGEAVFGGVDIRSY